MNTTPDVEFRILRKKVCEDAGHGTLGGKPVYHLVNVDELQFRVKDNSEWSIMKVDWTSIPVVVDPKIHYPR